MDYSKFMEHGRVLVERQFQGISWIVFAEMTCVIMMVAVILFVISYFTKKKINWVIVLGFVSLAIYLCFVYQITYYNRDAGSRVGFFTQIKSLSPKNGNIREIIYNLLNVILFVPIGMALAMIWSKKSTLFRCLAIPLYGLMGSMIIECAQFATSRGYFEVVDLIANTLGAVLGGLAVSLVIEIARLIKGAGNTGEEL